MPTQTTIPAGWKEIDLKDISKIYDGTHQTPQYVEKGVPFYSVEHITANDFSNTKFISEDVYEKESKRVKIEEGDILMTRIGDIGTAKHIDWHIKASFYVTLALIKCKNTVNSKFLTFLINSTGFQREIWKKTIHVAFPNKVNLGDIGKCQIILPTLPEQEKIVEILEAGDNYLEKLTHSIKLKKKVKKGLMEKLLTGKVRLKGFDDHWKKVELAEACEINPKNESLPNSFVYIDLESVEKGILKIERLIKLEGAPSRAQRKLNKRDILFQMVRPYQRNNLYFNQDGEYVASTGYAQIRTKNNSEFLYYILHTDTFVNRVLDKCTGSNYPAINSTDLGKIKIPLPPIEEQTTIANILTAADRDIEALEKKKTLIEQQKKFLLNNLITGRIRLPEFIH